MMKIDLRLTPTALLDYAIQLVQYPVVDKVIDDDIGVAVSHDQVILSTARFHN